MPGGLRPPAAPSAGAAHQNGTLVSGRSLKGELFRVDLHRRLPGLESTNRFQKHEIAGEVMVCLGRGPSHHSKVLGCRGKIGFEGEQPTTSCP